MHFLCAAINIHPAAHNKLDYCQTYKNTLLWYSLSFSFRLSFSLSFDETISSWPAPCAFKQEACELWL
jgi:hypothetical protein